VSDDSVIDPMVREAAANYAAEKKDRDRLPLLHDPDGLVCPGTARPKQRYEPSTSAGSGLPFLLAVP
jgi:hypothetical protein